MANKPFEIQSSTLTIGGVDLQAGTTGVVIPGVTQAIDYFVEEVDERGDQTVTFQSAPILIDYVTYLDYENNGSSSGRAEYSVDEIDDDGYIDGINIDSQGAYTGSEAYNGGNDLFAYTGTDTMPGIFVSFVGADWTQIPFRPRMRAGEIENLGGGADLGDFSIDGSELSSDSMTIKTVDGDLNIGSDTHVYINANNNSETSVKSWSFASDGTLTLPEGGDILDSNGSSVLGGGGNGTANRVQFDNAGSIYQADDAEEGRYNIVINAEKDVVFNTDEGSNEFRFTSNGAIRFPDNTYQTTASTGANTGDFVFSDNFLSVSAGNQVVIQGETEGDARIDIPNNDWAENSKALEIKNYAAQGVKILTGQNGDNTWAFTNEGGLTFPDGSIQTTAYTGQAGGGSATISKFVLINDENLVWGSDDGVFWTGSFDTGLDNLERVAVGPDMVVYIGVINPSGDPILYNSLYYASAWNVTPTQIDDTAPSEWNQIRYFADIESFVAVGTWDGTPAYKHSTDGITWTQVLLDNDWATTLDGGAGYGGASFTDIAYNGAGFLLISSNTVLGSFYTTTLITNSSIGETEWLGDNNSFDRVVYSAQSDFTGWFAFGNGNTGAGDNGWWYNSAFTPGSGSFTTTWGINGDVSEQFADVVNYQPDWSELAIGRYNGMDTIVIGSHDGQVLYWPAVADGPFVSIPKPYTNTQFSITSANPAVISWNGGQSPSGTGEKIVITGAGDFNGTFYVDDGNILYTDTAMESGLDSRAFAAYTTGGTVTFSHGQYIDALTFVNGKVYVGNDNEEVFISADGGATWVEVASLLDRQGEMDGFLNDIDGYTANVSASNMLINGDQTFVLNADGTVTFPDHTIQTTAYTEQDIIARQDTAPTATDGRLWFNTLEGRLYIKYDDAWVDAAPLMMPAPELNPEFTSITFPDASVQTTASLEDRLVNGLHEVVLNTNGDLLSANDIIATPDGRFIKDCGNSTSTTSMRWTNLPANESTEIIRLYTGDPAGSDSNTGERGKIGIEWQSATQSGLSFTSFDTTDIIEEYTWEFRGDGSLTFPFQHTNYRLGSADTLMFSRSTGAQKAIATQPGIADDNTVERLVIAGGDSYQDPNSGEWLGEGGDLYLWAGQGGNGGDLKLDAGNSLGLNGEVGGWIKMRGGDSSTGNGGYLELAGGDGDDNGGDVTILGGTGATGVDGKVRIGTNVAYVNNTPEPVNVWDFGADGKLTFPSGAGFVQGDSGQLKTNDGTTLSLDLRDTGGRGFYTNGDGFSLRSNGSNTWVFGTGGNITLPTNTSAINYANGVSILDGLGGGSSYANANVANYLPTHTGNVAANYFIGNGSQLTDITVSTATTAATVTTNAQPNITSVGTLSGLTVGPNSSIVLSGTSGYLKANSLQGHDGSQTIYLHYGEVGGAAGIATDLTVGTTGSGNLTANGTISATGNVTGSYFIGNGSQLTGVTVSTAATVTTDAQPNITSVGTLSSLSVIGNITGGNLSTGGRVVSTGNIVTGGQIQSSAFTGGNISWSVNNQTDFQGAIKVGGTGIIKGPGGASSITLNNNGANIPIIGVTNTANSTSTTTGALIVSGGAGIAGNVNVGGLVSATGTIDGGNLTTGGQVSATGNVTGANLITAGLLTVTGNITGGNIRSNGTVIASNIAGTITIGNTNSYMMGIGNVDNYVQSYVHNKSNTANASADMIVYGSAGTDNSGYMDMGMTSNNFSSSFFTVTGKSEGYLFMSGVAGTSGNMVLATGPDGTNNSIEFYVGGFNSAKGSNRPLLVTNTGISVTGNITGNTNGYAIGYRDVPQVAASNTTIALTDAGKHFYSTTAGNFTLTIPNNSTTSFSTGTAISIVVQAAGNILVNAASGVTLYMAGNSTAANRVVGAYGMATIMKVASDTWFINGTGVS